MRRARGRTPSGKKEAKPANNKVYVCGGRDGTGLPMAAVERFAPEVGKPRINMASGETMDGKWATWEPVPPLQTQRWGAAAATVAGKTMYVFGGYDGESILSSVEAYHTETRKWEIVPSMDQRRSQHAAAAVIDRIFVSGGYDGGSTLSSVECFLAKTMQWNQEALPKLHQPRMDHGMVAMGSSLYACGGAEAGVALASLERLNLDVDDLAEGEHGEKVPWAWEEMPKMLEARRGASCAVVGGHLWVFGGHNGSKCLSSVESFDPRARAWMQRPAMQEPRFGASAAFIGERVLVVGGHNGERLLNSAERFSPLDSCVWESVVEISEARTLAAVTLLDNPRFEPKPGEDGEADGDEAA